jgi:hypothetical protein
VIDSHGVRNVHCIINSENAIGGDADLSGVPLPMTPAEFGKLIADETEKWGKVIRAANIKPE